MQLVASITITRFLQPSDYGLAALAMLCYSMTGYFTQIGMGRAIIQKPDLTRGNIRAAFGLALLTGLAGFLILAALSPFLGRYFHEPRLPLVLIAFGLNLIFQSMSMVTGGLLRREFRIRDLAICDFLAYLLSTFGVGLPMAIKGFGVWALVGSNVSQPLIVVLLYFIARPHAIAPTWKREDYAHITGFSGKASITTSIEALGSSIDTIVMGRYLNPIAIGLYNRSLTLSTQPGYNISMGLTRVFHPTIARAAESSLKKTGDILLSSERQLLSFVFPFCAAAATAAPTIIPVLFGQQWISAVPVYQVLCLVAALDATQHLPAIQLEVLSLFRHKFIVQTVYAILFGLGTLYAAPRGGIVAVGLIYAVLQALRTIGMHFLSARSLRMGQLTMYRTWVPALLCSGLVAGAVFFTQRHLPTFAHFNAALRLIVLILLSALVIAGFYRLAYRRSIYDSWLLIVRGAAERNSEENDVADEPYDMEQQALKTLQEHALMVNSLE